MTTENDGSTSSGAMDGSRPWTDVIALGEHLAQRLSSGDHDDFIGPWMAHRIAELIAKGESSDRARAEATDLVLRCWEARRGWHVGWPRADLAHAMRFVDREDRIRHGVVRDDEPPWAQKVAPAMRSLDDEYKVWLALALMEDPPPEPIEDPGWFFDHEFDDEERRVAQAMALVARRSEAIFSGLGSSPSRARLAAAAQAEIVRLQAERADLFDEAARETARNVRSTAAKKAAATRGQAKEAVAKKADPSVPTKKAPAKARASRPS